MQAPHQDLRKANLVQFQWTLGSHSSSAERKFSQHFFIARIAFSKRSRASSGGNCNKRGRVPNRSAPKTTGRVG